MIYLNGPEMTLEDQTGQSLKTTGENDLLFMQLQRCNARVLFKCFAGRHAQVTLLTRRYFRGQDRKIPLDYSN